MGRLGPQRPSSTCGGAAAPPPTRRRSLLRTPGTAFIASSAIAASTGSREEQQPAIVGAQPLQAVDVVGRFFLSADISFFFPKYRFYRWGPIKTSIGQKFRPSPFPAQDAQMARSPAQKRLPAQKIPPNPRIEISISIFLTRRHRLHPAQTAALLAPGPPPLP